MQIKINRAPVLTLWAAIVAQRLGFDRDVALTLGRAVAGLTAYLKGKALGLFHPAPEEVKKKRLALRPKETIVIDLLGRAVPAVMTEDGIRALSGNRPMDPRSVERYLQSKFGPALDEATAAMRELAESLPPEELARRAFELYEQFRPLVPPGVRGWGRAGVLDLDRIRDLARRLQANPSTR